MKLHLLLSIIVVLFVLRSAGHKGGYKCPGTSHDCPHKDAMDCITYCQQREQNQTGQPRACPLTDPAQYCPTGKTPFECVRYCTQFLPPTPQLLGQLCPDNSVRSYCKPYQSPLDCVKWCLAPLRNTVKIRLHHQNITEFCTPSFL